MRRVVVTGMGAVSPLGLTLGVSWEAMLAGRTGAGPITRFDASGLAWQRAGEVRGFRAERFLGAKDALRADLFVQFAVAAAVMAAEDAGGVPRDAAVVLGSSRGGAGMLERAVRGRPGAYVMPGSTVSAAASWTARALEARGPVLGVSNACASGLSAVGEAFRLVRHGYARAAVAGGAEAPVCPVCVGGYGAMGALSRSGVCRPFDVLRDGFVVSEGSAVLVLEEREAALRRGALIRGEVLGYGSCGDGAHPTVPERAGHVRAIRGALADGGMTAEEVDQVSAHATGTAIGDEIEAAALIEVFGERGVPVSAVKGATGHLLGASGALEAAFALLGMASGVVPGSVVLTEGMPGVDVAGAARGGVVRVALCNSFGFGGLNVALLVGASQE